jgi:hypothetical protein
MLYQHKPEPFEAHQILLNKDGTLQQEYPDVYLNKEGQPCVCFYGFEQVLKHGDYIKKTIGIKNSKPCVMWKPVSADMFEDAYEPAIK